MQFYFFFNHWNNKKIHPVIREIKKEDRRKQKQKGKNAQNKAWYFSFLPRRAVWICVLCAFNRWRNSSCPQSLLRSFALFLPQYTSFQQTGVGGSREFLQNENTTLWIRQNLCLCLYKIMSLLYLYIPKADFIVSYSGDTLRKNGLSPKLKLKLDNILKITDILMVDILIGLH